MINFEPPNFSSPEYQRSLLESARTDFVRYYKTATPVDADYMDKLVIAHAGLVQLNSEPRKDLPQEARDRLERSSDKLEQGFTVFREAVRACPTFAALTGGEKEQIDRVVFQFRPPLD